MKLIPLTTYCLTLLACLFLNTAWAQGFKPLASSEALEQKLHEAAKNTKSLSSDFVQTKHLEVLSEAIVSEGKLYYKADQLLRWEYTDPLPYLIVLNQGKVSIKDDGKISSYDLSGNKTFQKVNEMVVRSIQGDLLVNEQDYRYEFAENKQQYRVMMYPKQDKVKEFMQRIEIYVSKKDYTVERVKMLEQSGDYTLMVFKNRTINATLSDQLFTVH